MKNKGVKSDLNRVVKSVSRRTFRPTPFPDDLPKKIIGADLERLYYCVKCHSPLENGKTFIPISNASVLEVSGMVCKHCGRIYVSLMREIETVLLDNSYARGFHFSFYSTIVKSKRLNRPRVYIQKSEDKIRTCLKNMCNRDTKVFAAYYLIPCDEENNDALERKCIAITSDRNICNRDKRYIFYADELARTVLAVDHYSSELKIVIDNEEYKISKKYEKYCAENYIYRDFWTVGSGGGIRVKDYEKFVDILVYSQKTKKYEIMKATERQNGKYYSDIRIYKEFIKKYGSTQLKVQPLTRKDDYYDDKRYDGLLSLNERSILRECGYSVNAGNSLSADERKNILYDIMKLEILDKPSIIRHLESNISLHTGEKNAAARDKWQSDLEFILSCDDEKTKDVRFFPLRLR